LANSKIITKNGISSYSLPLGFNFINTIDSYVLSSDKKGNLHINEKIIHFTQNVVAASIKDDLLALVFDNNTIALYDLTTNKFKLKEQLKDASLNDIRIANPIFLDDTVIFPTLNGKIILVNLKTNKILKTINVDPSGDINNIIYLQTVNDTVIIATRNKILSISDSSFSIKSYELNDIISANNYLYISTIDGKLIKLDLQLEEISSKKFKFARIFALAFGTSLYALESQGYLINLDADFIITKVYDFDFDETSKIIAIKDTLYFGDEYIKLK
jgi:hypothetical protein